MASNKPLITAIRVQKLFGLYSYKLPETGALFDAAILYGDNGVGKSTLLKLVFHLLSSGDNRGHRSALYEATFDKLEVDLSSGVTLSAEKVCGAQDEKVTLSLQIKNKRAILAIWDFRPNARDSDQRTTAEALFPFSEGLDLGGTFYIDKNGRLRHSSQTNEKGRQKPDVPRGKAPYLSALEKYVPTTFILTADRRLDSDSIPDPSDEVELRKAMRYEDLRKINDLVVRSREIALSQALSAAGKWISQKAILGTNQGSTNVHSVYGSVLKHLVSPTKKDGKENTGVDAAALIERLDSIEKHTDAYAVYEFSTALPMNEFRRALSVKSKSKVGLSASLLEPYIRSVEGRLEAIEPIFRLVSKLVTLVNDLLRDKKIVFRLSQGFSVINAFGKSLTPSALSSGEQQLLLLFCYVLIGRDQPCLFMIDEPEISLNVKWQRQLVGALLDLTEGAETQFIFASHSLELLSQHRHRVVALKNTDE